MAALLVRAMSTPRFITGCWAVGPTRHDCGLWRALGLWASHVVGRGVHVWLESLGFRAETAATSPKHALSSGVMSLEWCDGKKPHHASLMEQA